MPPLIVIEDIHSPVNSLGVVIATFITGSLNTGDAPLAHSSKQRAAAASAPIGVDFSSSYFIPVTSTLIPIHS